MTEGAMVKRSSIGRPARPGCKKKMTTFLQMTSPVRPLPLLP